MAIPINPYVAGNPVGDSPAFIGRADVLREVLRMLRRSQDNAIVLYGQRRIGKTSILQHLAAWLPHEGTYRPVHFDLQDKAACPLGRVLQDLALAIAYTLGHPDPDLGPDPETAFRQEWLPAVLDDLPDGSSLVLLFDEFDVLADPKAEQAAADFFPYLRDLLASDPVRLQFVFVIGRNVDDLTNIALSLFKGTPYQRVSLLDREDNADLVRLSQANNTLRWPDDATERVWQLTNGHPFLTQQLCSHIWERAYDEEPEEPPTVASKDVDIAVPDALEASRNTLEWLWGGLPPAERVVASALAKAGPAPITQEELERLLHESGVRVVIRELQNAPQLLQDWDLIEPANGAYRFRVELLRRWIGEYKPLHRVQDELDHIEPVAENLYQAALGLYQGGQLDQAVALLRQATTLNPNHVGANQLLADILLAQGQTGEARQLLEWLYEYQPAAARSRLVQALLAQAQAAEDDYEQLILYEQVLELDSTQPEATAKVDEIEQEMLRRDLAALLQEAEAKVSVYQPIQRLAQLMQARREYGEPPYVLLLGSSLSLTPAVRRALAGTEDWEVFWKEMQHASPTERKALLKKSLDALALELGYQAMARLAEAGYFNLILTLNVDDTLDNALQTLSVSEYRVWVHGEVRSREIVTALDRPTPRIKVIKLRGDINALALPLTATGQFEFPADLEQSVAEWLKHDMILVGDIPYDTDVQRCIRRGDAALWCVLPDEPPHDSFIMRAKQSRPSGEIITGADAEFNAFFTALAGALLLY